MSAGQVLILLLLLGILLLGGFALYQPGAREVLVDSWERFKAYYAANQARMEAAGEARRREKELGIEVGLPPAEVMERAIEFMTRSNYGIESRSENSATFARHQGADTGIGCFLMLFFLVPGLLYLLLAAKTVRVTLAAYPHEGGSRVVLGGDDQETLGRLTDWTRGLPKEPQAVEPADPGNRSESPSQAGTSATDRLRELAQLKEAGLITDEEYQTKRADILRSM